MPHPYIVLKVRLFLELTEPITDPRVAQAGLPHLQPPAGFIAAAREELGLNDYQNSKHGGPVFSDFWNPRVEFIEPLETPGGRQAFFAAQAQTAWEACCTQFETLPPRPLVLIASLLVEYELDPEAPLSEGDQRFLFLDCKRRYITALTAYRKAHPDHSEGKAANETWAWVTHDILMEYGLPEERLQAIVREGTPKWNSITQPTGSKLSFVRPSGVHWVITAPPRPKYTPRVV